MDKSKLLREIDTAINQVTDLGLAFKQIQSDTNQAINQLQNIQQQTEVSLEALRNNWRILQYVKTMLNSDTQITVEPNDSTTQLTDSQIEDSNIKNDSDDIENFATNGFPVELNDELGMRPRQREAYDLMLSGENVFLSGEAGTGKSYVINHFIKEMEDKGRNMIVCAPTGIAAINVGGTTIHRAFNAPTDPIPFTKVPKKFKETIKQAEILVFDEISMCRADLFIWICKYILGAERNSGIHKQVVVVGDFFQLPPVLTEQDKSVLNITGKGFAFETDAWKDMNFHNVVLNDVVRQSDINFIKNLNLVRKGIFEGAKWINSHASPSVNDGIYLCPTNKKASQINEEHLEMLETPLRILKAEIKGEVQEKEMPTEEQLQLKVGSQVMILINDSMDSYQNGTIGIIKNIDDENEVITIDVKGKKIAITKHTWNVYEYNISKEKKAGSQKTVSVIEKTIRGSFTQYPLKLAYAITIHKSQGKTFEKINLFPDCFEAGQLYVALSRATSLDGLHLMFPINQRSLISCPEVVDFYKKLC